MKDTIIETLVNFGGALVFIVLLPLLIVFGIFAIAVLTAICTLIIAYNLCKIVCLLAIGIVTGVCAALGYIGGKIFSIFKRKPQIINE